MMLYRNLKAWEEKIRNIIDREEKDPEHIFVHQHCVSNEVRNDSLSSIIPLLEEVRKHAFFFIGSTQGFYGAAIGRPKAVIHIDKSPAVIRSACIFRSFLELYNSPQQIKKFLDIGPTLLDADFKQKLWGNLSPKEKDFFNSHKKYLPTKDQLDNSSFASWELISLQHNVRNHWESTRSIFRDPANIEYLLDLFYSGNYKIVHADILGHKAQHIFDDISKYKNYLSLYYYSNIEEWLGLDTGSHKLFNKTICQLPQHKDTIHIFSRSYSQAHLDEYQKRKTRVFFKQTKGSWIYPVYTPEELMNFPYEMH